ncbi:MAG: hypothetical protein M1834_007903 [Cirrosporium novae-zelandiae]|nr:MAG: hypothetical protein M1834_007903 [Cirrosporium novae-zelandiae]
MAGIPEHPTQIQFTADEIQPVRSNGGGVYSIRNRRNSYASSKRSVKEADIEEEASEEVQQERDFRKKQEFKGWTLAWLAYQANGVIYGDIGTSPLYVYSSTFTSNPSHDDLLGAVSLIIWTLTLMVTVKYVLIVLRADDEGEGGTFALYSLISRYANIVKRDPKEASLIKLERVKSSDLNRPNRTLRDMIEDSATAKFILKLMGVLGVSLVMSDGALTPAQSVLGAIQGLKVVQPDISGGTIIGVSCAILILLFLLQPFGTSKLASLFSPIVIIWLSFNAAFGIYNLILHDASVLKAFSPYFAGEWFVRNKTEGWKALGGILLAFTGAEALFADLGAFSRHAVQLSWLCFAYPCLLLAYIGQAAYISDDKTGEAYSNPFFNTIPPGMFYPSLVVSILAAIVASQAMITSTFQLLTQIMKLSYFPQIKLYHTSKTFHGQVYIPMANWLLMIGAVVVTAAYSNTTKLGHAYGACVVLVTFITTCMVSLVALIIWKLNIFIVLAGFLVFGSLDGLYLSSALTKVPDGAWFTIMLGAILSSLFILWRFGKERQWSAEAQDRIPPSQVIHSHEDGALTLAPPFGGGQLTRVEGFGIFFDKAGTMTPLVFLHFVTKLLSIPSKVIFFHLRPIPQPSVPPDERYTVTRTRIPDCYRFVIRYGYTDQIISPDLATLVHEQLRKFVIREGVGLPTQPTITSNPASVKEEKSASGDSDDISYPSYTYTSTAVQTPNFFAAHSVGNELASLQRAFDTQITYIVGKEAMKVDSHSNFWRRIALEAFLWIRDNTRGKVAELGLDVDRLVEVGFVKQV